MTWSISAHGYKTTESEAESIAYEEAVAEEFGKFVKGLQTLGGVVSVANIHGGTIGFRDLNTG